MKNRVLFSLLILFTMVTLVQTIQAELIFDQHENVNYRFKCFDSDDNFCNPSSTVCTISIEKPDGTNAFENSTMTGFSTYFNHTLYTDDLGKYSAVLFCDSGSDAANTPFTYTITADGEPVRVFSPTFVAMLFGFLLLLYGIAVDHRFL